MAERLQKDVATILKKGRRCVLRCLLRVLMIFRDADSAPCYLLNDLYIKDYCIWIQKELNCRETLASLASALENTQILKSEVGLEIDLIENAAKLVVDETSEMDSNSVLSDQLINGMVSLEI